MTNLTPVQWILFIVGVELVSVPIISFLSSWIITQYFKAKDISFAKRLAALGSILESIGYKGEDEK